MSICGDFRGFVEFIFDFFSYEIKDENVTLMKF